MIYGIGKVLTVKIYVCKDVAISLKLNLDKFEVYFKSLLDIS